MADLSPPTWQRRLIGLIYSVAAVGLAVLGVAVIAFGGIIIAIEAPRRHAAAAGIACAAIGVALVALGLVGCAFGARKLHPRERAVRWAVRALCTATVADGLAAIAWGTAFSLLALNVLGLLIPMAVLVVMSAEVSPTTSLFRWAGAAGGLAALAIAVAIAGLLSLTAPGGA